MASTIGAAIKTFMGGLMMSIMQSGIVEVKLTRGLVTIIDAEDLELVSQYRWFANPGRSTHYIDFYSTRPIRCTLTTKMETDSTTEEKTCDYALETRTEGTAKSKRGALASTREFQSKKVNAARFGRQQFESAIKSTRSLL